MRSCWATLQLLQALGRAVRLLLRLLCAYVMSKEVRLLCAYVMSREARWPSSLSTYGEAERAYGR